MGAHSRYMGSLVKTAAHSRHTGSLVRPGAHSRYLGSLVRTGAHRKYTGSLVGMGAHSGYMGSPVRTEAHRRYTGSLVRPGAHSRYTGSLVMPGAHSRYTGSLAGSWVRWFLLLVAAEAALQPATPPLPSRVGSGAGRQSPGHLGALAWPASLLGGAADVATGSGNPRWAAVLGRLCLPFPPGPLPDRLSCPGEQGKLPASFRL